MPIREQRETCIVLAATENIMFSAGTLLANLLATSTGIDADYLIYVDSISESDRRALMELCPRLEIREYRFPDKFRFKDVVVTGAWAVRSSMMGFSRFECFSMLATYKQVVWLDTDILVCGSLRELLDWSTPESVIRFVEQAEGTLGSNFTQPVDGYDMSKPTLNAGVMVLRNSLPNPETVREWLYTMVGRTAPIRKGGDQGVLNLMLQEFKLVLDPLPTKFNFLLHQVDQVRGRCPLDQVVIAHAASRRGKFWNSLQSLSLFPDWLVHYQTWLSRGGSAYRGRQKAAGFAGHLLAEELAALAPTTGTSSDGRFLKKLKNRLRAVRSTISGSEIRLQLTKQELWMMRLVIDTYLLNSTSPKELTSN